MPVPRALHARLERAIARATEIPEVAAAMRTLQRLRLEWIALLGWRVTRWEHGRDPRAPFADEPDNDLVRRYGALRYRLVDKDRRTVCYVLELPYLLWPHEMEALLRLQARGWRVLVNGASALQVPGRDLQIEFWPPEPEPERTDGDGDDDA
jgi:hypothetical protein